MSGVFVYKKEEIEKMGKDVWKWIAVSASMILIGGAPGYFIIGSSKPTTEEVSHMILKESPAAIKADLKEIREAQKMIEIQIAKQSVQIHQILEAVK